MLIVICFFLFDKSGRASAALFDSGQNFVGDHGAVFVFDGDFVGLFVLVEIEYV